MDQIHVTLPWPPSINGYWRHVVFGRSVRVLISLEGRAFRATALWAIKQAGISRVCDPRPCAVRLVLYPPDRRRRDVDNYCKPVLDALTHAGVWADDCQARELSILRMGPRKPGSVSVVVTFDAG